LSGDAGNDRLAGGALNDYMRGGLGDDVYVYARGDGVDAIVEEIDSAANIDRIEFAAGISPQDVTLQRDWTTIANATGYAWTDLWVRVDGQNAIKISNYFLRADNGYKVEQMSLFSLREMIVL
jgi:hypothetical protein